MPCVGRWQVELRCDETDLALLATLFAAPELRVVRDEGRHLLEASELEDLQHHSEVLAATRRIVTLMNGATRLANRSYRNVSVGPIHERRPDGTRATSVVVEPATIEVRATVFQPTIRGGGSTVPLASLASRHVGIGMHDEDAREALDLWANDAHN
jgi:hypothetical protein